MVKNKKYLENKEYWKSIPNSDYIYEVSTYGRVRKNAPGHPLKLIRVWETKEGAKKVTLSVNGQRRGINVARLVADAFLKREKGCLKATTIKGNSCRVKNVKWVIPSSEAKERRIGSLYVLLLNGKEQGIYQSKVAMAMNSDLSVEEINQILSGDLVAEGVKIIPYEPA